MRGGRAYQKICIRSQDALPLAKAADEREAPLTTRTAPDQRGVLEDLKMLTAGTARVWDFLKQKLGLADKGRIDSLGQLCYTAI